jgi:hypothetical protein
MGCQEAAVRFQSALRKGSRQWRTTAGSSEWRSAIVELRALAGPVRSTLRQSAIESVRGQSDTADLWRSTMPIDHGEAGACRLLTLRPSDGGLRLPHRGSTFPRSGHRRSRSRGRPHPGRSTVPFSDSLGSVGAGTSASHRGQVGGNGSPRSREPLLGVGASSPAQISAALANARRVPWSVSPLTSRKIAPSINSATISFGQENRPCSGSGPLPHRRGSRGPGSQGRARG